MLEEKDINVVTWMFVLVRNGNVWLCQWNSFMQFFIIFNSIHTKMQCEL